MTRSGEVVPKKFNSYLRSHYFCWGRKWTLNHLWGWTDLFIGRYWARCSCRCSDEIWGSSNRAWHRCISRFYKISFCFSLFLCYRGTCWPGRVIPIARRHRCRIGMRMRMVRNWCRTRWDLLRSKLTMRWLACSHRWRTSIRCKQGRAERAGQCRHLAVHRMRSFSFSDCSRHDAKMANWINRIYAGRRRRPARGGTVPSWL